MTHDDARDAMPLFIVGADDAPTRAALLAHVADCTVCRQALQEYQVAADAMGRAVPQIRPRDALRQQTLDSLLQRGSAPPHDGGPQSPRVMSAWSQWLAAAAVLVAVASLAGLVRTRTELADMREALAASEARAAQAEQSGSVARAELVTHRQAIDVMTSDDLLQVVLKGVAPAERAGGKAFLSRSHNALIFSASALPALPPDRVYQLWAIAGGAPISAGLFTPDSLGRSQLAAELPDFPASLVALAVTVEPQGGVPSPTGPQYLLGTTGQ